MGGDKLLEMCDRTEIREVVYRYATGVDNKDWMLFGTCFTDPMEADMTATRLRTPAPQQFPLERWRRVTERTLSPWNRTQHYMSNITIKVDGDRAQCVAYLYARHYGPRRPRGQGALQHGRLLYLQVRANAAGMEDQQLQTESHLGGRHRSAAALICRPYLKSPNVVS